MCTYKLDYYNNVGRGVHPKALPTADTELLTRLATIAHHKNYFLL